MSFKICGKLSSILNCSSQSGLQGVSSLLNSFIVSSHLFISKYPNFSIIYIYIYIYKTYGIIRSVDFYVVLEKLNIKFGIYKNSSYKIDEKNAFLSLIETEQAIITLLVESLHLKMVCVKTLL